eukprot:3369009-Lingulodinium_polyedra.AAC.1
MPLASLGTSSWSRRSTRSCAPKSSTYSRSPARGRLSQRPSRGCVRTSRRMATEKRLPATMAARVCSSSAQQPP